MLSLIVHHLAAGDISVAGGGREDDSRDLDTWGSVGETFSCPYGRPGDLIWVKEPWWVDAYYNDIPGRKLPRKQNGQPLKTHYTSSEEPVDGARRRHARYMPHRVSRLTLELSEVWVQRLQDLSAEDAKAEGIPLTTAEHTFRKCFRDDAERAAERIKRYGQLWESLHGKGSWVPNPFVWALAFKVHHQNIDAFLKAREAE
jgi:hypothetical protein